MGIRTRIFIIILSCLLVGISLAFVVAERDLSLGIQNQIEIELSQEAKVLAKVIGSQSSNGNLIFLKSQIDEYSEAGALGEDHGLKEHVWFTMIKMLVYKHENSKNPITNRDHFLNRKITL